MIETIKVLDNGTVDLLSHMLQTPNRFIKTNKHTRYQPDTLACLKNVYPVPARLLLPDYLASTAFVVL